jgi:glycosyltransferase involved in cell wall biosynthesis
MRIPLVSIIMPTFNNDRFLCESVESILEQTFRDYEFIIINDGSTDRSEEILERYRKTDSRIRLFHQDNMGIVASLNRGIATATGKYIARMDGDDISLSERLARQVAFMEVHPNVGVCGTACRSFGEGRGGVSWTTTETNEIKARQLFWPCFAHPTVMMRHELIEKHGLMYRHEFQYVEDYDLWLRFSKHCDFANLPEELLLYRLHGAQICSRLGDKQVRMTGEVHRLALSFIGITPSPEEMLTHLSLHTSDFEDTREYQEKVESWLLKLTAANSAMIFCDDQSFRRVMFERWSSVSKKISALGIPVWRRFRNSPLYSGYYYSCPRQVRLRDCILDPLKTRIKNSLNLFHAQGERR